MGISQWSVLLLFAFLTPVGLYSQAPLMYHFDESNGLPSNEIYQIKQDSRGYIWLATSNGVSRFNGYEFENWSEREGIKDNAIFETFEDVRGNIWFLGVTGRLFYYDVSLDSIIDHPANHQLFQQKRTSRHPTSLFVDSEGSAYYSLIRNDGDDVIRKFHPDGSITKLEHAEKSGQSQFIIRNPSEDHLLMSLVINHLSEYDSVLFKSSGKKFGVFRDKKWLANHVPHCCKRGDVIAFSIDYHVVMLNVKNGASRHLQLTSAANKSALIDENGGLWVGTYSGEKGILYWRDPWQDSIPIRFLAGRSVSSALQDKDGGLWFPTLENGVFYAPSLKTRYIESDPIIDKKIVGLTAKRGAIMAFTDVGNISRVWLELDKVKSEVLAQNLYKILSVRDCDEVTTVCCASEVVPDSIPSVFFSNGREAVPKKNTDLFWTAGWSKVGVTRRDLLESPTVGSVDERISRLLPFDSSVLVGTFRGLRRVFESGRSQRIELGKEFEDYRITDLEMLGELVVVSSASGFWSILNPVSLEVLTIQNHKEAICDVFRENDSSLWMVSENILRRIAISPGLKITEKSFKVGAIISGRKPTCVYVLDSAIWIGTTRGLVFFDRGVMTDDWKRSIAIDRLKLEGVEQTSDVLNTQYFKHNENDFDIGFHTISPASFENIEYTYKLDGIDRIWRSTRTREVRYTDLASGEYVFSVWSRDNFGNRSPISKLSFLIATPFWKTPWFYFLVFFTLSITVTGLVFFRIRGLRRTHELAQAALSAEVKSLKSQVAPHFLFNAMNSILGLMTQKKHKMAFLGLSNFSMLLRRVVDNADFEFVSLAEELEGLELYISVEKMRFSSEFEYTFEVDDGLDTNKVKIPSMLLQPLVENAIWHGLLHKQESSKKLFIKCYRDENWLHLRIEDNGIGLARSAKMKKSRFGNRQSKGLKLVKERIRLMNILHKTRVEFSISEKKNEADTGVIADIKMKQL